MRQRTFKRGTGMYFGVPASPMPETLADALARAVAQLPGIREAYVPQCYIEREDEARQVLVLGFAKQTQIAPAMESLFEILPQVLPEGEFIDVLPFTVDAMPEEARVDECAILLADAPTSWWKFWRRN